MAVLNTYIKQPADSLDYDIDYSEFLDDGDAPVSVSVVTFPSGLSIDSAACYGKRVKLWISGGSDKTTYKVTVTVTTNFGRIKQDELLFKVKDI